MNETTSTIDANRTESYCDITELAAFHLGFYQQVNRIICFILGIPLNIFVLVVVVRSRQLWAPRNIFWLGITLFNSIAEVDSIMELTTNYLYQRSDGSHRLVCQIFSTQFGLPYSLLTAGLTLATCDRYLALARHRFYQKHANTKNAVWILIFTFVVVTGTTNFPARNHLCIMYKNYDSKRESCHDILWKSSTICGRSSETLSSLKMAELIPTQGPVYTKR